MILTSGFLGANPDIAARIGNREYTQAELDEGFAAYKEYRRIPQDLSQADSQALFQKYFDEIIAMNIYNKEIAERGISLTPGELEAEIRRNPPSGVRQIPDLMTDGRFDQQKYELALFERPEFRLSIMEYSRDVYNYHKLLSVIRAEAEIDSAAIRRAWMREGHSADATIIYFDYTQLSQIQVEEDEIRALYEQNLDEYLRENGRSLYFVRFAGPGHRASQGKEAEILANSEELYARAEEIGLHAAAEELGYELRQTPYFSADDSIIRGIGRDDALVRQAFANPVGTLLPYYQNTMSDIYICQVADQVAEYHIPYDVERAILEIQARSLKRQDHMQSLVQDFIRNHRSEQYLSAAESAGFPVIRAEEIRLESHIPSIGHVEALNRAILSSSESSFTPLIENHGFYYLARVDKLRMRSLKEWEASKDQILDQALQTAQETHLDEWYLERQAELDILWPPQIRHLQD